MLQGNLYCFILVDMNKTVVVGLSGGVDSSVSAYLLKQQGYKVIGLFMKNWEEEGGECPAAQDWQDVVSVAAHLDIPFYGVNFAKEYKERVFSYFLEESRAGRTPNPDILCNREIKFDALFKKARELGADYLATGHYARVGPNGELLKGLDDNKDQSYFLHALKGDILKQVLFPLGDLPKTEVRKIAREAGLSTAEKGDSTGICFIGERNFREFLSQFIPLTPGPILSVEGELVGEHVGLPFYTIGQRKGMGIGGAGDAWFVVRKELSSNTLRVAQGKEHPALFIPSLSATSLTWVHEPPVWPCRVAAKIRYRQSDQPCTLLSVQEGRAEVLFDEPQRAVTPGQSIVFYVGDLCLGGGVIE